jgi:hypothetical protein
MLACSELPPAPAHGSGDQETSLAVGNPAAWHDPDMSLFVGPPPEAGPDIIDYDIQNGFVFDGPAALDDLLLNVHDGQILDATNTVVLCRAGDNQLFDAATGELLFIADNKTIYEGSEPSNAIFVFTKTTIYAGRTRRVVATASEDLTRASPFRMLLIAALLSARCGAPAR